jgi:hypothetical protein
MTITEGLLYIAKGDLYVHEAKLSARQVKSVMPEYPVTIVTDRDVEGAIFDRVIRDEAEFSKDIKPRLLRESPYEKTIFLDTDVYLQDGIPELFEILGDYDMALVPDRAEDHIPTDDHEHPIDGVPEGFPEFNSGVIAYGADPAVMEFFQEWQKYYQPEHEYDQRSLRPALYHSDVRFTSLPRRYNCMHRHSGHVVGRVKAFHGPLVRRNGYHVHPEEAVAKLNASTEPCSFFGSKNTVVVYTGPPTLRKFWLTSQMEGPHTAVRNSLRGFWRRLRSAVADS